MPSLLPTLVACGRAFLTLAIAVLTVAARPDSSVADVIRVPTDAATIQIAIDLAVSGDVVSVEPGVYVENIEIRSKDLVLESEGGPDVTVIDGGGGDSVVLILFSTDSVLRGFTITNGRAFAGGGIVVSGGATIERNIVTGNSGCLGAGIFIFSLSDLGTVIRDNEIVANRKSGCSGGRGGGLHVANAAVEIVGNLIADNVAETGGGISVNRSPSLVIRDNEIRGNEANIREGGAISAINRVDALVEQNLIYGNSAFEGGGIHWEGGGQTLMVNNTIADNPVRSGLGSAIFARAGVFFEFVNNVLVGSPGDVALTCTFGQPVLRSNDVFGVEAPAYSGCGDPGGAGNISLDPLFANPVAGVYQLLINSPAIDTGDDAAAPLEDFDGLPRPIDGNGDGIAIADMGAFEFQGPDVLLVEVDIKPDSDTNPINPMSRGVIPVAILGSDVFDVTNVDVTTLAFGPAGAPSAHKMGGHPADVNRDGIMDIVSHYRTAETDIVAGLEDACVTGETLDGMLFEGCDVIQVPLATF